MVLIKPHDHVEGVSLREFSIAVCVGEAGRCGTEPNQNGLKAGRCGEWII